MRGTCKKCGYVGDVSPARNCVECIKRKIAEDPRTAESVNIAARLLSSLSPTLGHELRTHAAMLVLFAFYGRCWQNRKARP